MGRKYRFLDEDSRYFVTLTVVGWLDVFSRVQLRDIFIESLRFCQENRGLAIFSYVIMTNHAHLIISRKGSLKLSEILRDLKKFTSKKIIKSILEDGFESRKENLVAYFRREGARNSRNKNYQFWQQHNHPLILNNYRSFLDVNDYIHKNPVKAGIVVEPSHYLYSSAGNVTRDGEVLIELEQWS